MHIFCTLGKVNQMQRIKNLLNEVFLITKSNILFLLLIVLLLIIIPNAYILNNLNLSKAELRVGFSSIFTLLSSIAIVNWNISFLQVWLYKDSLEYSRSTKGYFVYLRILFIFALFNLIALPTYLSAANFELMAVIDFVRFFILQFFLTSVTFFLSLFIKSINLTATLMFGFVFLNFIPTLRQENKFLVLSAYSFGTIENILSYYLYVFIIALVLFIVARIYEKILFRF